MGAASDKLNELGKSGGQAADQMMAAGKVMTAAGAAILAPLGLAVKAAGELDTNMANVNSILHLSDDAIAQMTEDVMDMSKVVGKGPAELSDALYDIVSSGFQGQEALDILKQSANAATAGLTDTKTAAKALDATLNSGITSMDAYGDSTMDAQRASDVLFQTVADGVLTFPELANNLGKTLAPATNLGVTLEELGAGYAQLTLQGHNASATETELAALMTKMVNPTADLTDAIQAQGYASAKDVIAQKGLVGMLDLMFDAADGSTEKLFDLAGSQEAFNALLVLGKNAGKDYVDELNKMQHAGDGEGATQEALNEQMKGSAFAAQRLGAATEVLADRIGGPLNDNVKAAENALADFLFTVSDAPPALLGFIGQLGALEGGLLGVGGLAALGTGQVLKLGEQFAKAGLSLPIFTAGLLGVGLAIGAGLLAYETNFGGFADFVNGKMADAGNAIETFGNQFEGVFNARKASGMNDLAAGVDAFGQAMDAAFGTHMSQQVHKVAKAIDAFGDAWQNANDNGFNPAASALLALQNAAAELGLPDLALKLHDAALAAQRFGDVFEDAFKGEQGRRLSSLSAAVDALGTTLSAMLGTDVTPFFNKVASAMDVFQAAVNRAREAGLDPFTSALMGVRDAASFLTGIDFTTTFDNLGSGLQSGLDGLGAFKEALTSGDWDGAWNDFTGGLDSIGVKLDDVDLGGKLQGVSTQIMDWFNSIGDQLMGTEGTVGEFGKESIKGILPQLAENVASGIQGLPNAIMDQLTDEDNPFMAIGDWLGDQFTETTDSLLSAGDLQAGLGGTGTRSIFQELADGVTKGIGQLPTMVGGALDSLSNPFEGVGTWLGDRWEETTSQLLGAKGIGPEGIPIEQPGILQNLANDVVSGMQELPSLVGNKLGSLSNPFEDVGTWLGDRWKDTTSQLLGAKGIGPEGIPIEQPGILQDLANGVTSGLESLPTLVGDKLGSLSNPFEGIGTWLGDRWEETTSQLLGAKGVGPEGVPIEQAGILDNLADSVVGGLESLPSLVGDKISSIDNPFEGIGTWLGEQWTDISDQFTGGGDLQAGLGGTGAQGIAEQLAGSIGESFAELPDLIGEQLGKLESPLQAVGDWFDQQIHDPTSGFNSLKSGAIDAGTEAMQTITEGLGTGLATGGVDSMGGPGERGEALKGPVTEMLGGFTDDLISQLHDASIVDKDFYDAAGDLGKTLGGGMTDALINSMKETMTGDSMGGPGTRGEQIFSFGDAFGNFDKQFTGGMQESLGKEFDQIEPAMQTWFDDQIVDLGKSLATREHPLGEGGLSDRFSKSIMEGLGIDPEKGLFGQALEDMVHGLGDKVQGAGAAGKGDISKILGEDLGSTFADAIADPKFAQAVNKAMKQAPDDAFASIGAGFLDQITDGMKTAMETTGDETEKKGDPLGAGMGQKMVETLATGLADSITAAPVDLFTPVGAALGTQIGAGLKEAMIAPKLSTEQIMKGDSAAAGVGLGLVQNLATGLTDSITAAPPDLFTPVGAALGTQLGTALQTAMTEPGKQFDSMAGPGEREATAGVGQTMVQGLATGLTDSITAAPPELFTPVANALGTQLGAAMSMAAQQTAVQPGQAGAPGQQVAQGFGQQMVQGLATGLTDSITAADPALFQPVAGALGTQLGTAMSTAAQQTQAPGPTGVPTQVQGFGQTMVQGLATGLTDSITAADPALFVPVSNALGTQLGAAMSMAAQQTQAPGPTGVPTTVPGAGTGLVEGLALGLTDSITAAQPEIFTPVGQALGTQLGTALNTAMTQAQKTTQTGLVGDQAAGGIGTQMVQDLAAGLSDSVTAAPIETFTPVGAALGTKIGEGLQAAVDAQGATFTGPTGGAVGDIGAQMGESVSQMLISGVEQADFTPVGTSLQTKIGETLQTVAQGGGEGDISKQLGDSVGQMMQQGVDQADFSGVGESVSTQLTEQMDTAIQDVSTSISDSMSQITDAISEAVSSMGEAIGQATEEVSSAVEEMSSSIQSAVEEVSAAIEEMSASVEEASASMEEAAASAASAAEEIGTAAEEAAAAVEAAMQTMAAAVAAAAGAIAAAAGQIVAAFNQIAAAAGAAAGAAGAVGSMAPAAPAGGTARSLEIGTSQVQGMAKGMDAGAPLIVAASRSLATTAFDSLANAVGMGSPAKRFEPIGASISHGMMKGMLADAKMRIQSAMGKIAGQVASAMGKIKSAMASGIGQVHSRIQEAMGQVHSRVQEAMGRTQKEAATGGQEAGAKAAKGAADGVASGEGNVEAATRKLWKKALKQLLKGEGEMRFLGEEFAREFWEGMLDASGSLEFAQFVTEQAVKAAENAIAAIRARIAGLGTQIEIVGKTIDSISKNIADLESQLKSIDDQIAGAASAAAEQAAADAAQARIDAAQAELEAQQAITAELEKQFGLEFAAAHQAHIRAVQAGSKGPAQAEFESKFAQASATHAGIDASKAREVELAATLKAIQEEIAAESAARAQASAAQAAAQLQADRARIAEQLAAEKAKLEEQKKLQAELMQQEHDAQVAYTQVVIDESNKRIEQAQKELSKGHLDPEKKAELQAQIELDKQRIELANQLAAALERQANAHSPEELAQANAQVQYLTQAIQGLGEVDIGAMLQQIVSTLSETAASMSSAATSMGKAAKSLSEMPAEPLKATTQSIQDTGTAASDTGEKMFDMGARWKEVMDKMNADGEAFNEQFMAMVEKTRANSAQGGEDIGLALSDGIKSHIDTGAPAMQQSMLDGLQKGVDQTEAAAGKGGADIATSFASGMHDKLGVKMPDLQTQIRDGVQNPVDDAVKAAEKGGGDVGTGFGQEAKDGLDKKLPNFQTAMDKGIQDPIRDGIRDASKGGHDIGDALGDGIQQGIKGRANQIANDAAQTVRDAINAAHDAARTGSPSKAMMEVGDLMGLGLVYGLRGRREDAKDASAALVHIPSLSPTSDGGVTGRRAMDERPHVTTVHIEHLELPGVRDPDQFIAAIEQMAQTRGVSSGRG